MRHPFATHVSWPPQIFTYYVVTDVERGTMVNVSLEYEPGG